MKVCVDLGVALAAGGGHVEFVDRRMVFVGGENLVGAVAVGAYRGFLRAVLDGASVHALLVGDEGLRALAVRGHEELLAVTAAAGGGDIGVTDGRIGVAGGQRLVRATVAVDAGGSRSTAGLGRPGMHGAGVGLLGSFMASGAGDFLWRRVVDKALDVGVAIDASKQAAVNGMLQLVLIDEEADLLAVFVSGQGRIAVAGETVGILDLRSGAPGGDCKGQQEQRSQSHGPFPGSARGGSADRGRGGGFGLRVEQIEQVANRGEAGKDLAPSGSPGRPNAFCRLSKVLP